MMLSRTIAASLGKYQSIVLALLGCLSFALYALMSRQGVEGGPAAVHATLRHFFVILAALFALLFAAAMTIRATGQHKRYVHLSLAVILLGAVLFRAALLSQSPWLSNDVYRYLWDARLLDRGVNPYAFSPQADELASLRDQAIFPRVDHKHVHSVYPPLLQILFWTGLKTGQALSVPSFAGLKLIFALVDIGLVLLLFRVLAQVQIDPRWAILYAWHPLAIIEIAGSGHTDGVGAFTLVLIVACLMQRRFPAAAVFVALGFLVKFIAILFLPFLFVAAWKEISFKKAVMAVAIFVLLVAGSYAPFAAAGENLYSGLLVYSEKWRFNDGFFSLVFTPIHWLLPDGLVKFLMIPSDWVISANTLFTRRIDLALIITKLIVGGIFMAIYSRLWLRELKPQALDRVDGRWPAMVMTILVAFFLLSPTLQPWYLIWILPLLCLDDAMPAFEWSKRLITPLWMLSATVFLSYWVLADYLSSGLWQEPQWVKWVEYGIPLGLWLWTGRNRR
jgi:hypothetical protein